MLEYALVAVSCMVSTELTHRVNRLSIDIDIDIFGFIVNQYSVVAIA